MRRRTDTRSCWSARPTRSTRRSTRSSISILSATSHRFAASSACRTLHVSGELFKMMTGVDMLHVPYRGAGPMLTDLLGGQVQVAFDPMPSSIGYVKAGQLRPLAVTTATRSEALPELPSVGDAVAGYEASTWYGVGAPKNTPAEVIDRLNKE